MIERPARKYKAESGRSAFPRDLPERARERARPPRRPPRRAPRRRRARKDRRSGPLPRKAPGRASPGSEVEADRRRRGSRRLPPGPPSTSTEKSRAAASVALSLATASGSIPPFVYDWTAAGAISSNAAAISCRIVLPPASERRPRPAARTRKARRAEDEECPRGRRAAAGPRPRQSREGRRRSRRRERRRNAAAAPPVARSEAEQQARGQQDRREAGPRSRRNVSRTAGTGRRGSASAPTIGRTRNAPKSRAVANPAARISRAPPPRSGDARGLRSAGREIQWTSRSTGNRDRDRASPSRPSPGSRVPSD